jgi:phage terminase large subunit
LLNNGRLELNICKKLQPLYTTKKRFIDIYGGRGSSKSWCVADFLLTQGAARTTRNLCARETQTSIKDSVHKLLADRIDALNLSSFYTVQEKTINGRNGTEFIFKGLYRNETDIKSIEGIDYGWIEEANKASRKSLEIFTPTIRKENSQIIFTYNPTDELDPVHVDYTLADRDDILKIEINYSDNPWFPDVLKSEMEYDRRVDPDKYMHKWEGKCVKHSDAQVFYGKWEIKEFEKPDGVALNFGADWGFSNDPTTLSRSYIIDNCLYIDYEAYAIGCDIDKTPALFDSVPESRKWTITADSARPETISAMSNAGFKIRGAKKGKGSMRTEYNLLDHSKEFIYTHAVNMRLMILGFTVIR